MDILKHILTFQLLRNTLPHFLKSKRKLIFFAFSQITQLEISLDTLEFIQLVGWQGENRKWEILV